MSRNADQYRPSEETFLQRGFLDAWLFLQCHDGALFCPKHLFFVASLQDELADTRTLRCYLLLTCLADFEAESPLFPNGRCVLWLYGRVDSRGGGL